MYVYVLVCNETSFIRGVYASLADAEAEMLIQTNLFPNLSYRVHFDKVGGL